MLIHSFKLWALLVVTLLAVAANGIRLASQAPQSQAKPADPHAALRANNLGAAYMNQQRMEQALAEFERAAALDPKLIVARLNQGIALLNLQRIEPARAVLREVAERDAKNIRAWYNLGLLEKNAGDAEAALAAFEKAAALDSADPDTHYFIGTLHAQQNRFAEAIAAFERAIALNRFHVSAEFGLARALQRTGDAEKARAHLQRFQHLNTEKLGAPLSLAYGDQGPYSLAESISLPASAAPPSIPVKFTRLPAKHLGIVFLHPDGKPEEDKFQHAGATCVLDFNNDGRPDIFFVETGKEGTSALFENLGGKFKNVSRATGLEAAGPGFACAAGDYDNDGWADIAVGKGEWLVLFRNQGNGTFRNVTNGAGISAKDAFTALAFMDLDHDGDLDLYASRAERDAAGKWIPANLYLRNNGNGTFTDTTAEVGLAGGVTGKRILLADFNNDRAVDFVSSAADQLPVLFVNPREGLFHSVALPTGPVAYALIADLNRDEWMDLVTAHPGKGSVVVWKNLGAGRIAEHQNLAVSMTRFPIVAALDYDNDAGQDLVLVESKQDKSSLALFRGAGDGSFQAAPGDTGVSAVSLDFPSDLLAADFDGDGDQDLLVIQTGAPVVFMRNDGGNKNNWLKLSLKGLADNKSAIGTKVEVFAGASYQKFEITTPNDLLIGLGSEKQADVVRLLWPTGVLQDEVNLAANQRHVITQIDRRGSSCPVLFAWNGTRFEFIADAIGPGIVGHWVAPGVRNTSDPTEFIKVPGWLLRTRTGPRGERLLSFRFAEPMEEIVYLDQLRLFAIDHPSDTDVNPSERFYASGPPFPSGEPVFTQRGHARSPARVTDHRGRDVTALVRDRDRRYVSDFADAPYKGFAELHWIELDLGEALGEGFKAGQAPPKARREQAPALQGRAVRQGDAHAGAPLQSAAEPLRLLLHGYTDYFTATSVYAAHQGGVTAIVPYVEAQLADGTWQRIVADMGFPAGLARTMVADLSGKLPPGTRRIRIATNLKIYWDQILIDTTPGGTAHRITEAPLASARAGYLGYPREIRGTPSSDVRYDYHNVSATGPYARAAGHYTRYGDVRALVSAADDRFVLMGSGDEVAIDFDASSLPPVPEGWTRDWFFYVDGFAKDMDFYAAHPFTVTPLPYHAMPGYPYPPERPYPDRSAHLEDQLELNTRAVSGRPAQTYRYAYPK